MNIVLATGIYPPAIGGPATYVKALAEEMVKRGHEVRVVTYGKRQKAKGKRQKNEQWYVARVSNTSPILRWFLYARALRRVGKDADVIIAFSSVSVGIPLWMARLQRPKKMLRLGGDFIWERYTDRGGRQGLREWYGTMRKCENAKMRKWVMGKLLRMFDRIVFSTRMQEEIYDGFYRNMPSHSVIENSLPFTPHAPRPTPHSPRPTPLRLLFMGRLVAFKNLDMLLLAMRELHDAGREVTLTIVGSGPMRARLTRLTEELSLKAVVTPRLASLARGQAWRRCDATRCKQAVACVTFRDDVHGEEKGRVFAGHDLLIIPSITEISPNVALESRAAGLPVLLTTETGLSPALTQGMVLHNLALPESIVAAVTDVMERYDEVARAAATDPPRRSWGDVAEEWERMCMGCV